MRAPDSVTCQRARAACAVLLCCASWASSTRGRAQTAPVDLGDVQLSIPDCADVSGAQIAHLAALELAPHGNDAPSDTAGDVPADPGKRTDTRVGAL